MPEYAKVKNWSKISDFLRFIYTNHLFGLSRTRLNAIITIVLYLAILHGTAVLASAMQVMEIQIQIKIYEGNMALTQQMQFIGGVSGKWENMTKPF